MVSVSEESIEEVIPMQPESELVSTRWLNECNIYSSSNTSTIRRISILNKGWHNQVYYQAHRHLRELRRRRVQIENKQQVRDNALVFYGNDRLNLSTSHNHPLYVITSTNGIELKRAMLDPKSSLNIISLRFKMELVCPRWSRCTLRQNNKAINQGIKLHS